MQLEKLSIINYKDIQAATLNLSTKLNCFTGHNGEGKTNLLDAVCYLSFCRSTFNPEDSEVTRHNADYSILEGDHCTDAGEHEQVYCGMKRGLKKHFKRNEKEYRRLPRHIGLVPLIFVSPADATLIEGRSEERRKLVDVVISQYDTPYVESLSRYNRVLQQCNNLLKQEEEPDATLLELFEMQMVEHGEVIYKKWAAFAEELTPVFQRIYQTICSEREQVSLEYVSYCQRGDLLDVIQRDRVKDRIMGYSFHDTHKDDLVMKPGGYPMKREGSQGQDKTYVLALRLVQLDFLRRTAGNNTPLLLLDDIFDKLDSGQVEQIVCLVSGDDFGRVFITDTNRDHLDKILQGSGFSYKLFSVEGGEINEREGQDMFRQKVQPLDDLLNRFLRQEGLGSPLLQKRIIAAWDTVAGETVAQYTQEKFIKNQTLLVKVIDPALRANLCMMQSDLVKKLNAAVGSIVISEAKTC